MPRGPYKYDVAGNQIIDYVSGNGSLIMGHSPPEVTEAVVTQARRGTNIGAAHVHEILYAEAIIHLMPSLERVRFTCTGTEATMLAVRLARAYANKTKLVKFNEHFHGWHDYVTPESGQSYGGVPKEVVDTVIVAPVDAASLERILAKDHNIAAVIVESHGAHYGTFPLRNPQFLHDIREITQRHGVVFIMDEVVTGFRLSPGGAQVLWDIEPDLTTMAKIMAGGQPGGAVGGKADIMEMLGFRDEPAWDDGERVAHAGSFNAQPVTAAAGIATLDAIVTGGVLERADAAAQRLKDGLNEALERNEVTGHSHGISSIVHVNLGADCHCDRNMCTMPYEEIYRTMPNEKVDALRRAMLVHGVEMMEGRTFFVTSAHDQGVVDRTVEAFSESLKDLRREGVL